MNKGETMQSDDVAWLSATDLVDAYRTKRVSPVEVTRGVLARVERLNPSLNCFSLIDPESALRDARASEARWMQGAPLGLLDGVPASIKDLVLTRGWPTLRGSLTVDPAGPWLADAPATARLREAGAVLLGKTTTPEFGWRASTDSPLTGITRNPWRHDVTPGGSSGGATAAVAAGLGPLAIGTDGGGSVRIPAAFTGTVGLKANFGRVPAYPMSPMGTVAHIGPQTRTVADAALMLDVIAAPDRADWMSLPPPTRSWRDEIGQSIQGLRIGYSPRLGYVRHLDPEIEAAVGEAASALERLGAHVERVDPDLPDSADVFRVHWFSLARQFLHRLPESALAKLDPGLRRGVDEAARYRLADYLDAQNARADLARRVTQFHQRYDLLLTPATAVQPFAVGRVMPDPPPEIGPVDPWDWTWWTPYSFPFNLTQQPAIVVGCGFSRGGLPLALQLVAAHYREDLCLRAAHAYQSATDWHLRRPPV
jgi:aspartyl-tRNA(Asn)/glutamyl-tRNA(Gln) amidotransferase subunit A